MSCSEPPLVLWCVTQVLHKSDSTQERDQTRFSSAGAGTGTAYYEGVPGTGYGYGYQKGYGGKDGYGYGVSTARPSVARQTYVSGLWFLEGSLSQALSQRLSEVCGGTRLSWPHPKVQDFNLPCDHCGRFTGSCLSFVGNP